MFILSPFPSSHFHIFSSSLSSFHTCTLSYIQYVCIKEDYDTLSACWMVRPILRVHFNTEICKKKSLPKNCPITSPFKPLLILPYSLCFSSLVCYTQQVFPTWVDTAIAEMGDESLLPVFYLCPVELHKRLCKQGKGQLLYTARKIPISWNRQVSLEGSQPSRSFSLFRAHEKQQPRQKALPRSQESQTNRSV